MRSNADERRRRGEQGVDSLTRQRSSSAPPRPRPFQDTGPHAVEPRIFTALGPGWSEAPKHRSRTPLRVRTSRRNSPASPRAQKSPRKKVTADPSEAAEGVPPRRSTGAQHQSAIKEAPLRLVTLFAGDCACAVVVDSIGHALTYVLLVALLLYVAHVRYDLDAELLRGCYQQLTSGQQNRPRKNKTMLRSTWREWWTQRRHDLQHASTEWFVVLLVYLLLRTQGKAA
jgi:hypothetical protein